MNRFLLSLCACATMAAGAYASDNGWSPAGDRIMSQWGETLDPSNVLPEYPRPIMERTSWMNLNGLWEYSIINKGEALPSGEADGDILVPFAIESALSGVGQRLGENKELVYTRTFTVPADWKGKNVLLNFGAVDWKADVWVNGIKVGSHTGGYTPFSFDITEALVKKGENTLTVKVWDPTDRSYQPRGKQVNEPNGIWYTPVSGIWQTVWLEPVSGTHFQNLRITPDIDAKTLTVAPETAWATASDMVEVNVYDGKTLVSSARSINGEPVQLTMPADMKLWSPDSPFLYDLKVTLYQGGKAVDQVTSYAAMRKFSTGRDKHGIVRLHLNNEPLFQFGPLDQGWWPR